MDTHARTHALSNTLTRIQKQFTQIHVHTQKHARTHNTHAHTTHAHIHRAGCSMPDTHTNTHNTHTQHTHTHNTRTHTVQVAACLRHT